MSPNQVAKKILTLKITLIGVYNTWSWRCFSIICIQWIEYILKYILRLKLQPSKTILRSKLKLLSLWPFWYSISMNLGGQFANLGDQCCNKKTLLFWWSPHCKIKVNLKPNPICIFFHFISLHFPLFLLRFCACSQVIEGFLFFFF